MSAPAPTDVRRHTTRLRPAHRAGSLAALCLAATAAAQPREDVVFQINQATTFGQSVYVVGSLSELGGNNAAYALKLDPGAYPTWRATIALPRGASFTYQYTIRNDSVSQWSNPSNTNPIGTPLNGQTAPLPAVPAGKGLFYHSAWTAPLVHWRITGGGGAFQPLALRDAGPGRGGVERRWRARGIPAAGRSIDFYFTDGTARRDPATGTYSTLLDAFFVQDGQLFTYVPSATVGPPQQTNFGAFFSAALNENRPYRVVLPRGYANNLQRRYPVLYLHDGQNVFDLGPFGTWNADETAAALIRSGALREIIMVGVENTANRARDYIPPDDIVPIGPGSGQPGRANVYAQFLIHELKPHIDATYRTLTGRDDTATLGSSLGGVVSLYLGWDHNAVFARCGPMSGSWQLPNFPARVRNEAYRDLRVYLDSGDSGTSNDNAWPSMSLRDGLLTKGYVLERTLRHVVGYGHQHNEAAWAARLPQALTFLFPATEDAGGLHLQLYRGDANCDGEVNNFDVDAFVLALTDPAAYRAAHPLCDERLCDANDDGGVNNFDIDAFVALLVAP
ncbi:MAG: alpha/beta hydrolase-fold protein [Phycisphaerae bacterium]